MEQSVFDQTQEELSVLKSELQSVSEINWETFVDSLLSDTIMVIDKTISNEETRDELTDELSEIVSDEIRRLIKERFSKRRLIFLEANFLL